MASRDAEVLSEVGGYEGEQIASELFHALALELVVMMELFRTLALAIMMDLMVQGTRATVKIYATEIAEFASVNKNAL